MEPGSSKSHKCVICKSRKDTHPHLMFHRFPKNKERCLAWTNIIQIEELRQKSSENLNTSYRVCSRHFSTKNYLHPDSDKLCRNACPDQHVESSTSSAQLDVDPIQTGTPRAKKLAEHCTESATHQMTSRSYERKTVMSTTHEIPLQTPLKNSKKSIPLYRQLMIDHNTKDCYETYEEELTSESRKRRVVNSLSYLNEKARGGWTESVKEISFALFHSFPKEYDTFSKCLSMPTRENLRQWISGFFTGCGFRREIFYGLQYKLSSLKDSERVCTLAVKELPLKPEILYSSKGDHVGGLVDFGNLGRIKRRASRVLVFTVRGIRREWSLPVGYFLTERNIPSAILKQLLLDCVSRLQEITVRVRVLICEHTNNFTSLLKDLEVCDKTPYFEFAGSKIFCMFDPTCLRNMVRNTLKKKIIYFGRKLCSWKYIEELNSSERKMCSELNSDFKVSNLDVEATVSQNPFTMQTSSKILVRSRLSRGKAKKEAEQTSAFIRNMHDLCSMFGCYSANFDLGNKANFSADTVGPLLELNKWVRSWKGSPSGQYEWLITMNGLLLFWTELHCTYKVKSLSMGRFHFRFLKELSQFLVKENEGQMGLPNAKTFCRVYNEYLCKSFLMPVRNSKHSFRLSHLVSRCEQLMSASQIMSSENICSYHFLPENENVKLLEVNKLAFIACHIIRKLRLVVSCKNCLAQLTQSPQSFSTKSAASSGNVNSKVMPKKLTVIAPHEKFLRIMPLLESSFLCAFENMYHMQRVKVKIHQYMYAQNSFDDLYLDCEDVKKIIIGLFINISLDHVTSLVSVTSGRIVVPKHL